MLSITLKIAVEAPIPSASVMIATTANPGAFPKFLNAYRRSCPQVPMLGLPPQRLHAPLLSYGSLDPLLALSEFMYAFLRRLVRRCPTESVSSDSSRGTFVPRHRNWFTCSCQALEKLFR